VGEAGNPQSEIIAARTSFAADTWAFEREDVRDTANAAGTDDEGLFHSREGNVEERVRGAEAPPEGGFVPPGTGESMERW
jgi:hypothetical protein